eukprot:CAMPEP_0184517088 /NCGR_PEP_ID=MMETSP0198_2-20121128/5374_1 /TAXON_ID=1112570 /ORGANISM="Thraustochytrium sp., Strain LLF1b" /LENGTH=96 /DNA_ID=CAMNT_0026907449 /DNA_START=270 /DNA_END=560 /DNA_ORIENTATION=+
MSFIKAFAETNVVVSALQSAGSWLCMGRLRPGFLTKCLSSFFAPFPLGCFAATAGAEPTAQAAFYRETVSDSLAELLAMAVVLGVALSPLLLKGSA